MFGNLKYLFLAAAAALSLASCVKPERSAGRIAFGVADAKTVIDTKAYSESTLSSLASEGFNVAGLVGSSVMFNSHATKTSSYWYPDDGTFYFPSQGTMDFFAAYHGTVTVTSGTATLSYSQNGDTDLLVSRARNVVRSSGAVTLAFDHALSLLHFRAVGSDAEVVYKVRSVKLIVPASGTYNYGASFDAESWSLGGSTVEVAYSTTLTTLGTSATDIAGALTVIPCVPVVNVEWDTYALDGVTLIASYSGSKSLGSALLKGRETTVTLTLPNADAESISFSLAINPWDYAYHSLDLTD